MAAYKLLLLVAIAATGIQLSVCDHKPEVAKQVHLTVKPIIKNIESKSQVPTKPEIRNIESKSQAPTKPEIKNIESKSQIIPEPEIKNIESKSQTTPEPTIQNVDTTSQAPTKPEIKNIASKSQTTPEPEIKNIESKSQTTLEPEIKNIASKSQTTPEPEIKNIESKSQTTLEPEIKNIASKSQTTPEPEIKNIESKSQTTPEPEIENESQSTVKPEINNVETKAHALERKIFQNIDAKWLAIVYKKKSVFECDCSESNIANGLEHVAHGILISPNSVAIPMVKKLPKKSDLVIRVYDMKLNSTITRSTPYQQRQVILVQRSKRNTKAAHFELLGFKDPIENVVSPKNYGSNSDHCYQLYLNKISNDYVFRAIKVSNHASSASEINTLVRLTYQNHVFMGAIETAVPRNATEAVQNLPFGSPLVCYNVQQSTTSVIGVNVNQEESAQWNTMYYYMRARGVFTV
ncbi:uncharacterized protein LOC130663261 [Microplitis mediator]|uniref:uncharacterized protein LOC130663261 n=1 Tax=Microplitis mediator TaxID=375433 RepID=UPI002553909C|nr:uncharacterized protein LOC130663261 [Microplitis mediator]